jgi:hypothetical protein
MLGKDYYLFPEDLFRVGNSTEPRLTHIRAHEITTTTVNGILCVVANNKGVSVWDEANIRKGSVSGWAWIIPSTTELPPGLKLHNDTPGHYVICPVSQMTLDEYKGLLAKLAVRCQKSFQIAKRQA